MAAVVSRLSHAEMWRQPITLTATAAAVLIAAAFSAGQITHNPALVRFFDNLQWTIANGSAALLAYLGFIHASAELRAARRWFAIGLGVYFVGQIIWDLQVAFAWTGFPTPSDVFYLACGPCIATGIWLSLRQRCGQWRVLPLALDVSALTCAVLALVLALYLSRREPLGFLQLLVMAAYPISMFTGAAMGLVMIPALQLRLDPRWMLLLLALVGKGVLWMQWNSLALEKTPPDGTWLNFGFAVTGWMFGVGAATWRTESSENARWKKVCEALLLSLPLMVVAAAVLSVALVWMQIEVSRVVQVSIAVGAAAMIVLAVLRQSLLLSAREKLLTAEHQIAEARKQFHALAERLSLATEAAGMGIWDLDLVHNHLIWDERMHELYGVPPGKFEGGYGSWAACVHPDDIVQMRAAFNQALADKKNFHQQFRIIRGDGAIRYLEAHALLQFDREGNAVRVTGANWDVTEHRLAEQALADSEAELRAIFDNAAIGVLLVSGKGVVLRRNAAYRRFLGYDETEFMDPAIGKVTHEEDRAETFVKFESLVRGERDFAAMEKRYIRKDGSIVWGRISATTVQTGGDAGRLLIAMVEDITERKQAEEALRLAQERELHAREEFAYHLMTTQEQERQRLANELHDGVGQSLSMIKNTAHLALEYQELPAAIVERLKSIQKLTSTAISEVRGLAHNLRPLHIEQLGVAAALTELIEQFSQSSKIQVESRVENIDDAFPHNAMTHIYRMLQEAITNIAKHSTATRVTIRIERDVHAVLMTVIDNGRGFEVDWLALHKGLGLTSISERAHMLGGQMQVQSAPGEGTTLVIKLPIRESEIADPGPVNRPQIRTPSRI